MKGASLSRTRRDLDDASGFAYVPHQKRSRVTGLCGTATRSAKSFKTRSYGWKKRTFFVF